MTLLSGLCMASVDEIRNGCNPIEMLAKAPKLNSSIVPMTIHLDLSL